MAAFRPTMVVLRFYSLVKVVSVSKKLYLFRLSLKNTLEFRVFWGIFKVELKFFLGQPAITRLVRLFTSTYKSSHYFAT